MAEAISAETFILRGCLYAETVKEAYDRYESAMLKTGDPLFMRRFFDKVWEENAGKMYADFYYPVLPSDRQERFILGLNEEERQILGQFDTEKKTVYYKIDYKEYDFLFEITARNWLFSSFYAADKKLIIWGNYDLEFPVFCEDRETLEYYVSMAKKCGLESYL